MEQNVGNSIATLRGAEITVMIPPSVTGVPVIHVVGEPDVSRADASRVTIAPESALRSAWLIFDFGGLRCVDSSAIALLAHCAQTCRIEIRDPSRPVRKVIEITGRSDLLALVS
jgi:anti-anti-sigma factor